MFENLSSLLGSLKSADETSRPLDDLIPSLRKSRKLAGMSLLTLFTSPLNFNTKLWYMLSEIFVCVSHLQNYWIFL